jgi:hypothetical protein
MGRPPSPGAGVSFTGAVVPGKGAIPPRGTPRRILPSGGVATRSYVHSVRTMPRRRSGATLLTHTTQGLARTVPAHGMARDRGRT